MVNGSLQAANLQQSHPMGSLVENVDGARRRACILCVELPGT
jgi:hypothetical protein